MASQRAARQRQQATSSRGAGVVRPIVRLGLRVPSGVMVPAIGRVVANGDRTAISREKDGAFLMRARGRHAIITTLAGDDGIAIPAGYAVCHAANLASSAIATLSAVKGRASRSGVSPQAYGAEISAPSA